MEFDLTTKRKGTLASLNREAAAQAVEGISLGMARRYVREIHDETESADLLEMSRGNEAGILDALLMRIRMLESQGRSKGLFSVTKEFEVAPVSINFKGENGQGRSTHVIGERDINVTCTGGVASHASKPLTPMKLEQAKIARKGAALVKQRVGEKPKAQVTVMPKILNTVDYSRIAMTMAKSIKGDLTGVIVDVVNEFETAAQLSQYIYGSAPADLKPLVSEHKGFKYIGRRMKIDLKARESEQENKKLIKQMLNVYPGHRSGPGNLASSHMDGVPLTGKMRTMLDHVQDFRYVDADVYQLSGSKAQVYTSIFKRIQKIRRDLDNEKPFLVTYVNKNKIMSKSVRAFTETDERGDIAVITRTGVLCGVNLPRISRKLVTYYADFEVPGIVSKDKISLEADTARQHLLDRAEIYRGSPYQIYGSYLAMAFDARYKEDENYRIKAPAEWDAEERYIPSVLGRRGIMIYTGARGEDARGLKGIEMAALMLNMIYHSIIYVYVGQHERKFAGTTFLDEIEVDFSLTGTVRVVASAISGGVTAVGEVLGEKFKEHIEDALSKQAVEKVKIERKVKVEEKERDDAIVEDAKQAEDRKKNVESDEEEESTSESDSSTEESSEDEVAREARLRREKRERKRRRRREKKRSGGTGKVGKSKKGGGKKDREKEINRQRVLDDIGSSGAMENLFGMT